MLVLTPSLCPWQPQTSLFPLEEGITRHGDFYHLLKFYQEVKMITRDDCTSIYTTADWSLRKDETKELKPQERALSRTGEWPQHYERQAPCQEPCPTQRTLLGFPLFSDIWEKRGPIWHMASGLWLNTASSQLSKSPSEELASFVNLVLHISKPCLLTGPEVSRLPNQLKGQIITLK